MREAIRETALNPRDFIYPLFVVHGKVFETHQLHARDLPAIGRRGGGGSARGGLTGISAVLLFGIPATKDPIGVENFSDDGIVQQAVRAIKNAVPDLMVVTDVCLCEYTDHGHCGILNRENPMLPEGYVLNDETLDVLAKASVSHATAGADIVAPSGMIDGMVTIIRDALDESSFSHIPVMSYSIKYASGYYGPFREAAEGAPKFGDRKTHQMDPGNVREAIKEAGLDVEEGADFLMVKPSARLSGCHPTGT